MGAVRNFDVMFDKFVVEKTCTSVIFSSQKENTFAVGSNKNLTRLGFYSRLWPFGYESSSLASEVNRISLLFSDIGGSESFYCRGCLIKREKAHPNEVLQPA